MHKLLFYRLCPLLSKNCIDCFPDVSGLAMTTTYHFKHPKGFLFVLKSDELPENLRCEGYISV
jgi:hypothetical protein